MLYRIKKKKKDNLVISKILCIARGILLHYKQNGYRVETQIEIQTKFSGGIHDADGTSKCNE